MLLNNLTWLNFILNSIVSPGKTDACVAKPRTPGQPAPFTSQTSEDTPCLQFSATIAFAGFVQGSSAAAGSAASSSQVHRIEMMLSDAFLPRNVAAVESMLFVITRSGCESPRRAKSPCKRGLKRGASACKHTRKRSTLPRLAKSLVPRCAAG